MIRPGPEFREMKKTSGVTKKEFFAFLDCNPKNDDPIEIRLEPKEI